MRTSSLRVDNYCDETGLQAGKTGKWNLIDEPYFNPNPGERGDYSAEILRQSKLITDKKASVILLSVLWDRGLTFN